MYTHILKFETSLLPRWPTHKEIAARFEQGQGLDGQPISSTEHEVLSQLVPLFPVVRQLRMAEMSFLGRQQFDELNTSWVLAHWDNPGGLSRWSFLIQKQPFHAQFQALRNQLFDIYDVGVTAYFSFGLTNPCTVHDVQAVCQPILSA